MKRNSFSNLLYNPAYMNREKYIATAGLFIAILAFLLSIGKETSSPLPLIIICGIGLLLSFRLFPVINLLILFGGASLIVYPLLYKASPGYAVGGVLLTYASIVTLIKWWKQKEN